MLPRYPDGGFSLESWDEAFGGHAGVLLRPIPKLRIGVTYQSPEFYKFGFNPHLTDLGPGLSFVQKRIGTTKVNVPLEEPMQVMTSAVYEVLPNFSLLGNVGWQNWSAFGEFPVGISATNQKTVEANLHFSDTFQIAIGQQFGSPRSGCGRQDLRMTVRPFRKRTVMPSFRSIVSSAMAQASSMRSIVM